MTLESEAKIKEFLVESRSWYSSSYLAEVTFNKSLMIILVGLLSILIIFNNLFTDKSDALVFYFPIFSEDGIEDLYNIKSLNSDYKSLEEKIAAYMVTRYLLLRESYSPKLLEPKEWENLLQKVAGLSSYQIFEEFVEKTLPNRSNDSPILKYRLQKIVKPIIEEIKFTKVIGKKPFEVTIKFTKDICDLSQINCARERWLVKMTFDLVSVNDLKSFDQAFPFKILSYDPEKLLG
jgi:type IV secretory pathway component VirB8